MKKIDSGIKISWIYFLPRDRCEIEFAPGSRLDLQTVQDY